MKQFLLIILVSCVLKVKSQCSFSITPTYTPPTCSTCCDGIISFTTSGSFFCSPIGYTLTSTCCIYTSPGGTWNNLCAGSYTISLSDGCCLGTCGVGLPAGPTGIKEKENPFILNVFPNPVSNVLCISTDQNFFNDSEIEILNCIGQTVLRSKYRKEFNVSDLTNGVYFLRIKNSQDQISVKRFVVTK